MLIRIYASYTAAACVWLKDGEFELFLHSYLPLRKHWTHSLIKVSCVHVTYLVCDY